MVISYKYIYFMNYVLLKFNSYSYDFCISLPKQQTLSILPPDLRN